MAPVPQVVVDTTAKAKYVVAAPHNIGVLLTSLPKGKVIGHINIKYSFKEEQEEEDYDEDEQLYSAILAKTLRSKYPDHRLELVQHGDAVSVVVPHFANAIVNHLVARQLAKAVSAEVYLTLSPCSIQTTLSKLPGTDVAALDAVPLLRPPHFITGFGAALAAETTNRVALVLNAEGQPGFEKLDPDALVDAAYILARVLDAGDLYPSAVSRAVRKFNSYSNSGMYI